jgi:phage-related minor tail protein
VAGWASTFSAQLTDMVWAADTSFKQILESFGRMLTQMIIQYQVVQPLLSSFGIKFGAAQGAAFDKGKLLPFAQGGIVGKSTIFPMAGGMGLMGEKGPEAVMPLTRTPSGDLGVKAETGKPTAPNVQINMINQSGYQLEASQKHMRQESGTWVIDVVMTELRTGRALRNMIRSTT